MEISSEIILQWNSYIKWWNYLLTRKNLGSESCLYQFFIYMLRWEHFLCEWVDEMKGVLL